MGLGWGDPSALRRGGKRVGVGPASSARSPARELGAEGGGPEDEGDERQDGLDDEHLDRVDRASDRVARQPPEARQQPDAHRHGRQQQHEQRPAA